MSAVALMMLVPRPSSHLRRDRAMKKSTRRATKNLEPRTAGEVKGGAAQHESKKSIIQNFRA
jgi:hypothetical protein